MTAKYLNLRCPEALKVRIDARVERERKSRGDPEISMAQIVRAVLGNYIDADLDAKR